ncbi:hypothetical protein ACFLXQ_07615 [Chloroflexota bacterium]
MDLQKDFKKASSQTAETLKTIAQSQAIRKLSHLTLPEIEAVVGQVAQVIPAGNVPGVILNGLARLSGRKLPLETVKRDIDLLFKGVEQVLDGAVYSAFFAGPAAVIWGYQNLLKLVGKGPDDAFPEGIWQFYADYALREDTARHANETHGFDTALNQHQIQLNAVDRATAWTMAAIHTLHQYNNLLENEWRERVYIYQLRELTANEPEADQYVRLYREWEQQRPYGRSTDSELTETYPAYRRAKFGQFLAQATAHLSPDLRREWEKRVQDAEAQHLPAYLRQMSILAYLDPSLYGEKRIPIPLEQAHVALIHQGRYYLIPVSIPDTGQPVDVNIIRAQIATLMHHPAGVPPAQLTYLAEIQRTELSRLRRKLNPALIEELDRLRLAPIQISLDPRPRHLPLSVLRRTERGVGDHALTLIDTGETFVFDQSHIFFDGTWGAALAEIITNEALAWAVYLHLHTPFDAQPGQMRPYAPAFQLEDTDQRIIQQAAKTTAEACAETEAVNLKDILKLRQYFKQRSDLLQLTVNDLLVLYRAIHAATYQPNPELMQALEALCQEDTTRQAAQAALDAISSIGQTNPAIVIVVDASQRSPRDRLYPITFEVPLHDLDLLNLHHQVMEALDAYKQAGEDRKQHYTQFDELQRRYLATLAGFGIVLSRAKEIAISGQSASVGTIKLLAHMPTPLQRMLDKIPEQFDILNDLIKGREVLSNVGAVAPTSTLTRFITAKDDNAKKTLAWGVITDADKVMRVSLRDFRPHVSLLEKIGRKDLAVRITQDYLDAFARGMNNFMADLHRITQASRETHPIKPEQQDE